MKVHILSLYRSGFTAFRLHRENPVQKWLKIRFRGVWPAPSCTNAPSRPWFFGLNWHFRSPLQGFRAKTGGCGLSRHLKFNSKSSIFWKIGRRTSWPKCRAKGGCQIQFSAKILAMDFLEEICIIRIGNLKIFSKKNHLENYADFAKNLQSGLK